MSSDDDAQSIDLSLESNSESTNAPAQQSSEPQSEQSVEQQGEEEPEHETVFFGLWSSFLYGYENSPQVQHALTVADAVRFVLQQKIQVLESSQSTTPLTNLVDIVPGDILYHSWFPFGHSSIARGFILNRDTNNESYQFITDCGAQSFTSGTCVNQSLVYSPSKHDGSITRIRFTGTDSNEARHLRYGVAILADYLGITNQIQHGGLEGICSYFKKSCYGLLPLSQNTSARRTTVWESVHRFYDSIFSATLQANFICSTMAIVLWQLVFALLKPEYVDLYLPLNAEGCIPKDINDLANRYPQVWQSKTIKGFNKDIDDNLHFPFDGNLGIDVYSNNRIGGRPIDYLLGYAMTNDEVTSDPETRAYSSREIRTDLKDNFNLQFGVAQWMPLTPRKTILIVTAGSNRKSKDWRTYWYPPSIDQKGQRQLINNPTGLVPFSRLDDQVAMIQFQNRLAMQQRHLRPRVVPSVNTSSS